MAKAKATGRNVPSGERPASNTNPLKAVADVERVVPAAPAQALQSAGATDAKGPLPGQDIELTEREEMIRQAAYHRYLQRNGDAGSAEDDWLSAESEIDGPGPQTEGKRERP
jgi:hypothetical protein